MYVARYWDPEERDYFEALFDCGEVRKLDDTTIPIDCEIEYGFLNSNGQHIYHGDILRIPWLKRKVICVHTRSTKTTVPVFVFDSRAKASALELIKSTTARPAFIDSRIENLGSYRQPRVKYERREKPVEPERVDIYARIRDVR